MNVVTRRMMCMRCGKQFEVTPWVGGNWRIAQAIPDAVPFLISSTKPVCTDPRCEAHGLADMNCERVTTEAGHVIVIESCEKPRLN